MSVGDQCLGWTQYSAVLFRMLCICLGYLQKHSEVKMVFYVLFGINKAGITINPRIFRWDLGRHSHPTLSPHLLQEKGGKSFPLLNSRAVQTAVSFVLSSHPFSFCNYFAYLHENI